MTSWAVHTIRAHVSDIPRHGPSLFTLWLGNLKHSTGPRRNTCTIPFHTDALSFFLYFFFSHLDPSKLCLRPSNPPNSKTKDSNVSLFSFRFIRYMVDTGKMDVRVG